MEMERQDALFATRREPSPSLWRSVAVKSVRLGWPAGWERASEALGSQLDRRQYLLASVFEDLWPSGEDLPKVLDLVEANDVEALCRIETHHGRGLTSSHIDACEDLHPRLEAEPGFAREMQGVAYDLGVGFLTPRGLWEFAAWLVSEPPPAGDRDLDRTPWSGVPPAFADRHCREGWQLGTPETVLSGSIEGHRRLARAVAEGGWPNVRASVHTERL